MQILMSEMRLVYLFLNSNISTDDSSYIVGTPLLQPSSSSPTKELHWHPLHLFLNRHVFCIGYIVLLFIKVAHEMIWKKIYGEFLLLQFYCFIFIFIIWSLLSDSQCEHQEIWQIYSTSSRVFVTKKADAPSVA